MAVEVLFFGCYTLSCSLCNATKHLSTNQVMAIVFFSISMGLAMGMIQTRAVDQTLAPIENIYEAFMQLFR